MCCAFLCVYAGVFFYLQHTATFIDFFFIEIIRLKTDKVWNHFFGLVLDVFLGYIIFGM